MGINQDKMVMQKKEEEELTSLFFMVYVQQNFKNQRKHIFN